MMNIDIDKYIVKRSNKIWGRDAQLFIAVEELSELIQSISKARREKPHYRDNLIEELADCYIVMEILKDQFNICDKDIESVVEYKQQRLDRKMDLRYVGDSSPFENGNMDAVIYEEQSDLPPWYVFIHQEDESYFLNIRAASSVEILIDQDAEIEDTSMIVSIISEKDPKIIIGKDIFTVLVKMERFGDVNIEPAVEELYYSGSQSIRDNYNFRLLYKKFNIDTRDRLFPDGMK